MVENLDPNMTWPCPRCKVPQVVTAMYCANCGLPLGAPGADVVTARPRFALARRPGAWIVAIIVATALIAGAGYATRPVAGPAVAQATPLPSSSSIPTTAPIASDEALAEARLVCDSVTHGTWTGTACLAPLPVVTPAPTLDQATCENVGMVFDPTSGYCSSTPEPEATPVTLFSFKGTGNTLTKTANVPDTNDTLDVAYTFDCRNTEINYDNFIVHVRQGSEVDYLINELGAKGHGTVVEDTLTSGPIRFEVQTGCKWTLKVIGLR